MNNEEARILFSLSGIEYKDIDIDKIVLLIELIRSELIKDGTDLKMEICELRNKDVCFNLDGSLKECYLMVDGFYFKRREAISFNRLDQLGDCFIGFAGWAGGKNTVPFLNAFEKWVKDCF